MSAFTHTLTMRPLIPTVCINDFLFTKVALEHRQKQLEEQGRLSNPSFGNTLVEMERLRTAVANGAYGSKTLRSFL